MKSNQDVDDFRKAFAQFSPLSISLKTYIIFFVGLFLVPIEIVFDFSIESVFFFLVCVTFSIIATYVSKDAFKKPLTSRNNIDWYKFSKLTIYIGTIGIGLAFIDRIFLRGVGLSTNALEAREIIMVSGSGLIGVTAAYMSAFAVFGVILHWIAHRLGFFIPMKLRVIAYFNLLAYVYLSILLGSRSTFLVALACHVIAVILIQRSMNKKVNIRLIASLTLLAVLTSIGLVSIFQSRLDLMGISPIDSIQVSAYSYTIKPTAAVLDALEGNIFLENFGASFYSMVLYVYHGIFEFFNLYENFGNHYTYGQQLLWLPLKLINTIFKFRDSLDLESISGYRSGIFTTFFGPVFVDFGVLAPIFVVIIYVAMTIPYRKVGLNRLEWSFAAIQCNVIIMFSPIINLLSSATGAYLLVASISMAILAPRFKVNR